jgi:hypothetical protein
VFASPVVYRVRIADDGAAVAVDVLVASRGDNLYRLRLLSPSDSQIAQPK